MAGELRFEHRMSDADALMWRIEKDPLLRSTIVVVATFDAPLDQERVVDRVERATRLIPRLRQRVVGNPLSVAPPRWEVDPHFDLSYHLRRVRVAGAGTLADVIRMAEPVAMQSFDRARPLWEMVIAEGMHEGGAAVILKLHHSITDGMGAVRIGMALFDLERQPGPLDPAPPVPEPDVLGSLARVADALEHERRRQLGILRRTVPVIAGTAGAVLSDPGSVLSQAFQTAGSVGRMLAPASRPLSPVMTGRSLSCRFDVLTVPLRPVKAAARRAGGRINDAFVAAVLGGLRRYHDKHGVEADALRMSMPINIRSGETEDLAGNQFAPARFIVPLSMADPVERMRVVRDLVAAQRAEPALGLVEPLAGVLRRIPVSASVGIFGGLLRAVDLVTSNVPGVPVPVYFAGSRLLGQYPFGPRAGAALNFTLISHVDDLHVGINIDPAAVPDVDAFLACLADGFDEILALA